MFEAELERVRKQLKQQIASSQPYISIAEILGNDHVHPSVRAFFRAEVDWWVHEERAIRSSNPRFATMDPVFADVFRRLDGLYTDHARYDHEELSATIDAAAKTWLNYLCRPRVTLRWFVFRGEPTKPLHEILLRLGYVSEYRYLTDGFRHWAASRSADASGFEILSVIEFERIIEKIDNDAILDLSQTEFVALLEPLFDFFAAYDPDLPPESIPTEAVIIFLDDKGAVPISQELERMLYREELRTLTRSKLLDVIEDVLASLDVDDHVSNVDTALLAQEAVVVDDNTMDGPLPEPDSAAKAGLADVSLLSDDAVSNMSEPAPPEEPSVEPTLLDAKPEEPSAEPAPLDTMVLEPESEAILEQGGVDANEHVATQLTDLRLARLSKLVDERMRERVLKRVFGRRETLMDEIIARVAACSTWKEAATTLDRCYAEHGIEPNTAAAIEFSQAVYRSFLNGTP